MPNAGVRFPPPFIYAALYLIGLAIERWVVRVRVSALAPHSQLAVVGWVAVAVGFTIAAAGMRAFRRHRTAVLPFRPAKTVVQSGPYRWTRNPMYLGLAIFYGGLTFVFDTAVPLLLLPLAIAAMQMLVISREERYLTDAFGDEYRRYQQRVRRWL